MKMFRFFKGMMIVSSIVLTGALTLSSCEKDDDDNNNNNQMYTISGNASGSQMVPAVTGTGSGTISGTFDAKSRTLIYTSTWTDLSGAPTSAGFYNGAAGTVGAAVGSAWNLGAGLSVSGTFTDTLTLTTDQSTQLIAGNWYYSYGTLLNAGGEIRGQITTTAQ